MKRNIYLSYIHSESMNYKFKITDKFKGRKYKFSSEDFDVKTPTAVQDEETLLKLAKNISHSDVTVVFITRSVLESKWIPLEVQYSIDHSMFFSKLVLPKGILCVVIPDKGNDYSYIMKKGRKGIWQVDQEKIPVIISANMYNEKQIQNKYNIHYDSFISVYRWEDFIKEVDVCVEAAYDKANNYFEDYNITKK